MAVVVLIELQPGTRADRAVLRTIDRRRLALVTSTYRVLSVLELGASGTAAPRTRTADMDDLFAGRQSGLRMPSSH